MFVPQKTLITTKSGDRNGAKSPSTFLDWLAIYIKHRLCRGLKDSQRKSKSGLSLLLLWCLLALSMVLKCLS